MNEEKKLLETLFPGPRRLLACALFGEPERLWSLSELAGRAGVDSAEIAPELTALCECGLARRQQDQGRTGFKASPSCPIFAEVQSIIAKLNTRTKGETILVVEDQPATARITRILLESWGYHVLEAHGAAEAIDIFEAQRGSIHLLLSDVIMPGMSGPQLAVELRRRQPELRVVYMSGYPNHELRDRNVSFLAKPFNPAGLSRIVRRALDGDLRGDPGAR